MDDFAVWMIAGAVAAILIPLACYFLPAQTKIIIDTPTSTARAEMRLLWGLGPVSIARALPKRDHGAPLARDFNPRAVELKLGMNLSDTAQSRVVQTAVQAALAAAPAALREKVVVVASEAPGAEISGEIKLNASPAQLSAIWSRFRRSRAAQEFRRRLTKKKKPGKKDSREVRVS